MFVLVFFAFVVRFGVSCFIFDFGSVAGKMVVQQYADFCIFDFVHTHECRLFIRLGWAGLLCLLVQLVSRIHMLCG